MPNVMQQLFVMNIESLLREYAAYRAFNKSDAVINMPDVSKVSNGRPDLSQATFSRRPTPSGLG